MKYSYYIIALVAVLLAACQRGPQFTVEGTIDGKPTEGESTMVYLTNSKGVKIDSVDVAKKNKFVFKHEAVQVPELFKLTYGKKSIVLGVDADDKVKLTTSLNDFSTYNIESGEASKEIWKLRNHTRAIYQVLNDTTSPITLEELDSIIQAHKTLAIQAVMANPKSSAAYYAIHETINGHYYLSLYVPKERSMWQAVATSYLTYYPESEVAKELEAEVLSALQGDGSANVVNTCDDDRLGAIDIALPNLAGEIVKLSSLKGKVVLLDFSSYDLDGSSAYYRFLNDLYAKYASKGLEIYQVSLDQDKVLWGEGARSQPWISVRDNDAPFCKVILTYNVLSLPTTFLLNREGNIVGKFGADKLAEEIEKLL